MKPQELRKGNYVQINDKSPWYDDIKGLTLKVVSISLVQPLDDLENTDYGIGLNILGNNYRISIPEYAQFIAFIKPIPLTEEWLLKLGFISDKDIPNLYLNHGLSCNITNMEFTYMGQKIKKPLYVHQVQNLFYFLTGKELNETN